MCEPFRVQPMRSIWYTLCYKCPRNIPARSTMDLPCKPAHLRNDHPASTNLLNATWGMQLSQPSTDLFACCTSSSTSEPVSTRALENVVIALGAETAPPPSSRIAQRDRHLRFQKGRAPLRIFSGCFVSRGRTTASPE